MTLPVNTIATSLPLYTETFFDNDHTDTHTAPVDHYIMNRRSLMKLYSVESNRKSKTLANLILLGIVSAVESYCREIVRRLIILDTRVQRGCAEKTVNLAAALHHKKELLPEAILEHISFASSDKVWKSIGALVGLKNDPPTLAPILEQFSKICQLRHCAVHRFGRLGSMNAISLGFEEHKSSLEKPLTLSFADIQACVAACDALVFYMNQHLYEQIPLKAEHWTLERHKDRRLFKKYYEIFHSTLEHPDPDQTVTAAFNEFWSVLTQARRSKV